MSWNVLSIVEHGASAGSLYPVPTKKGLGIELFPDERVIDSYDFGLVNILRKSPEGWRVVYKSVGNKGTLLVTDQRLAVVFKEVPKNRSFLTVVAIGQAIANAGKHRGESLVGHVLYPWITSVAARKRSIGVSDNTGMLRIACVDDTDGDPTGVMLEINKNEAPKIAHVVARELVAYRRRSGDPTATESEVADWVRNAATPFDPPAKQFEVRGFIPCKPVRAG